MPARWADGHEGRTLAVVVYPARTVTHKPAVCRGCGGGLEGRPVSQVEHHRVVDLPAIRPVVVKYPLAEWEADYPRFPFRSADERCRA